MSFRLAREHTESGYRAAQSSVNEPNEKRCCRTAAAAG